MLKQWLLIMVCTLSLAGCSSLPAPRYQVSKVNIDTLKEIGDFKVGVDAFTEVKSKDTPYPIGLRGGSLISPYRDSFASYIEEASRVDLMLADRFSSTSPLTLRGVLLKNDLDASGINIGEGIVVVDFTLSKDGFVTYKNVISQAHTWESSIIGAAAVTNAVNQYPVMIEKLLYKLFSDSGFKEAVRKSFPGQ